MHAAPAPHGTQTSMTRPARTRLHSMCRSRYRAPGGGQKRTPGGLVTLYPRPALTNPSRGTVVVVGREITDPAERAQLGIGVGETAVEVTAALLPEVA